MSNNAIVRSTSMTPVPELYPVVTNWHTQLGEGRTHGYIALYSYVAVIDTVFVLAIRGQWEAGYVRG